MPVASRPGNHYYTLSASMLGWTDGDPRRPLVTRQARKILILAKLLSGQLQYNIAHSRPLPSPALQRLWLAHINYIVHAIVFRGSDNMEINMASSQQPLDTCMHELSPKKNLRKRKPSFSSSSFSLPSNQGKKEPNWIHFTYWKEGKDYVCMHIAAWKQS